MIFVVLEEIVATGDMSFGTIVRTNPWCTPPVAPCAGSRHFKLKRALKLCVSGLVLVWVSGLGSSSVLREAGGRRGRVGNTPGGNKSFFLKHWIVVIGWFCSGQIRGHLSDRAVLSPVARAVIF